MLIIDFDEEDLPPSKEDVSLTVVVKVIGRSPPNLAFLQSSLLIQSNCPSILSAHAPYIFSAVFFTFADKMSVLKGGPWNHGFDLILVEVPSNTNFLSTHFSTTKLWVRIFDLPFKAFLQKVADKFGEIFGGIHEVDLPKTELEEDIHRAMHNTSLRFHLRIKLTVDVNHSLPRGFGFKVTTVEKKVEFYNVGFSFENVSDICFGCGRIGHQYTKCPFMPGLSGENLEYQEWIKANDWHVNHDPFGRSVNMPSRSRFTQKRGLFKGAGRGRGTPRNQTISSDSHGSSQSNLSCLVIPATPATLASTPAIMQNYGQGTVNPFVLSTPFSQIGSGQFYDHSGRRLFFQQSQNPASYQMNGFNPGYPVRGPAPFQPYLQPIQFGSGQPPISFGSLQQTFKPTDPTIPQGPLNSPGIRTQKSPSSLKTKSTSRTKDCPLPSPIKGLQTSEVSPEAVSPGAGAIVIADKNQFELLDSEPIAELDKKSRKSKVEAAIEAELESSRSKRTRARKSISEGKMRV